MVDGPLGGFSSLFKSLPLSLSSACLPRSISPPSSLAVSSLAAIMKGCPRDTCGLSKIFMVMATVSLTLFKVFIVNHVFRDNKEDHHIATWSCPHRFTCSTICSIGCDKVDDLCAGFSDEIDCEEVISGKLLFMAVAAGATVAVCMAVVMNLKCEKGSNGQVDTPEIRALNRFDQSAEEREEYNDVRGLVNCGDVITNIIIFYHNKKNIVEQKTMAKKIFDLENKWLKEGEDVDISLFKMLDTCETTTRLYDLEENSLGVKIESMIYGCIKFGLNRINEVAMSFMCCVMNLTLHYSDVFKDLFLAYLIYWKGISGVNGFHLSGRWGLPSIMFVLTLASVLGAEMANIISLTTNSLFKKWGWGKRLLSVLLIPLMPAVLILEEIGHSFRIKTLSEQVQEQISDDRLEFHCHLESALSYEKEWMDSQRALLGEFKANVGTIENFVQSTAVLLMILISETTSPMMEGFEKMFLTEGPVLLYTFATLSFVSLAWSQVTYIASIKRGALGIKGKGLLFVYSGIGAATRLFMVVIVLTPALGLMGTQNVFARGSMEMQSLADKISNFKWQTDRTHGRLTAEIDEFLLLPSESGMWILLLVLLSHLTAASVFLQRDGGWFKRLMHGVRTIIVVPLFSCDWEEIYKSHLNAQDGKTEEAELGPGTSRQNRDQEVAGSSSGGAKASGVDKVDGDSAEKGVANPPHVAQGIQVTFPLGREANTEAENDIEVSKSSSTTKM